MFIAIPAAVDNNGAAILDASLSVDNIIEDMSNAVSTASESAPEYAGFSRRSLREIDWDLNVGPGQDVPERNASGKSPPSLSNNEIRFSKTGLL